MELRRLFPCLCILGRPRRSMLAPEHHHASMDGATAAEWKVLDEWFVKLSGKYPTVGMLTRAPQATPRAQEGERCESVLDAGRSPRPDEQPQSYSHGAEDGWREVIS